MPRMYFARTNNLLSYGWYQQQSVGSVIASNASSNILFKHTTKTILVGGSDVSLGSNTTGTSTASTALSVTKPTTTNDGDYLLFRVISQPGQTVSSAPAGLTLLSGPDIGDEITTWTYYKVASGEGSTYSFTMGSAKNNNIRVMCFEGGTSVVSGATGVDNIGSTRFSFSPSMVGLYEGAVVLFVEDYYDGPAGSILYNDPTILTYGSYSDLSVSESLLYQRGRNREIRLSPDRAPSVWIGGR